MEDELSYIHNFPNNGWTYISMYLKTTFQTVQKISNYKYQEVMNLAVMRIGEFIYM